MDIATLLRKSPSLRKCFTFWHRHTASTVLFKPIRAININDSFMQPDFEHDELWTEDTGWKQPVSIQEHMHIMEGEGKDFSGTRTALLAHWDKNGIIAPYVLHYAAHLRDCGFEVVLTSGGPLNMRPDDAAGFSAVMYRDCPGYDFTSWKGALEVFPSLLRARELYLTNDSIFAPVGSFAPLFHDMEAVPCDFWGAVESHAFRPYLQSYALLFREKALHHPAFTEFFQRVSPNDSRKFALYHELRLGLWLVSNGLSAGAWLPAKALPWTWFNPLHRTWRQLIMLGIPILKRDMFFRRDGVPYPRGWKKLATKYGYPVALIDSYLGSTVTYVVQ